MAPELVPASVKPAVVAAAPVGAASRAYVTFLAGDGDYVKGVVGLAKGLRKAGSAYPLVVAVLPDVPAEHRRVLVEQGCVVREIDYKNCPRAAAAGAGAGPGGGAEPVNMEPFIAALSQASAVHYVTAPSAA